MAKKQEYIVNKADLVKPALFPKDILFGASTSAYQIEGAAGENGKGPSIWDVFAQKRGNIRDNHNGSTTCDHYHRFKDDVSIMSRLGLGAYRFSISWSRILPEGRGTLNGRGLDFYERLVDELLKAGIRPFATLFHWDLPYQLFRKNGGFLSRDTARYFADYAELVAERLGDRVKDWITLNEPWVHATMGYLLGLHAPGLMRPVYWSRVLHNQLLAHAWAMERIKAVSPVSRVGITLNIAPPYPYGKSAANKSVVDFADQLLNRVLLDPLFKGEYPEQMMRRMGLFWPEVSASDMAAIRRPMNFLGINLYSRIKVLYAPWIPIIRTWFKRNRIPHREFIRNGIRYTSMGWEVYPKALYESLINIRDNYGNIPVYITENGASFTDKLDSYRVHDEARIHYLAEYTAQAARAAAEGCDLRGYFVWSLLDNFEWAEGYSKRFGIVHVDFETGRRTIKDSGYWYRDLILANKR